MIKVEGLTKRYRDRAAVEGISFEVAKGEVVGFLGPNGAGKTTTMRMLTGYLRPTLGSIQVANLDMLTDSLRARRHIGYLPEHPPLYLDMSTRGYLEYCGRIRGLQRKRARERAEEVSGLCGFDEYLDTTLRKLSKGFRQRVGLAQAIIHDPQVLILDEPTAGIDPIQISQTKALIKALGHERTILLSTHILPDVSAICERVIIIRHGRVVAEDRIEDLSAVLEGHRRLRLEVKGPPDAVTEALRRFPALHDVRYEAPAHIVTFETNQEPRSDIARTIVENGWTLLSMEPLQLSLEGIFLNVAGSDDGDRKP